MDNRRVGRSRDVCDVVVRVILLNDLIRVKLAVQTEPVVGILAPDIVAAVIVPERGGVRGLAGAENGG